MTDTSPDASLTIFVYENAFRLLDYLSKRQAAGISLTLKERNLYHDLIDFLAEPYRKTM